jgi:hypothetical protein
LFAEGFVTMNSPVLPASAVALLMVSFHALLLRAEAHAVVAIAIVEAWDFDGVGACETCGETTSRKDCHSSGL